MPILDYGAFTVNDKRGITMDRMTQKDVEYIEKHTFDGDIDTQSIELEQDLAMLDDAALED